MRRQESEMRPTRIFLQSVLLSALLGGSADAQALLGPLHRPASAEIETPSPMPASFKLGVSTPGPYRLGALRKTELDAVVRQPQLPLVGIERSLDAAPQAGGEWLALDDGKAVWRMAIQSDGASGVRVHFHDFAAAGGAVWVYSEDRSQVFGPYTGSGIDESGDFWSHIVFADTVVVEYLADQRAEVVPFSITRIAHLMSSEQTMSAGTCELDVTCYSPWGGMASGVGMYIFESGGASYQCSGALVNNSNNDAKPYFLTANHCISTAAMAQTVEVFWKYQTATCDGTPPSLSGLPTTLGATYLASAPIPSGDFSLIQLSQLPNSSLTFYGWNASSTALPMGGSVVGMHHPEGDYTRIVFGSRNPDATVQVGTVVAPASMFYQIQATAGVIEPGSSGSPLFTPDESIVGTLTYGPTGNACSISPFVAGYARFAVAYPSLSQYLSPAPAPAVAVTPAPASLTVSWTMGTPAPAAQTIQLSTTSAAAVSLTAKASQSWIGLSAASLSVSQSKTASLSITLSTASLTLAGTYTGSITLTGTGVSVAIPVVVSVNAAPTVVIGGQSTLIPLIEDGAGVATSFTLLNPYASPTVASLSFFSAAGAPISIATGTAAAASWQNLTIPAYGAVTIATTGSSSPQKQGFAMVETGDATKRVPAMAQVGLDLISPSVALTPPFVVPFDATSTATTTLYIYNPASAGSATLELTIYNSAGTTLGTGQIVVPALQQGTVTMSKSAAVFGGQKGTLYVTGSAPVWSMGVRVDGGGRIDMVPPSVNH